MADLNERITLEGVSFGQQYILQKGLKVFGKRASAASMKELDQLHKRNCFTPISVTDIERKPFDCATRVL